jgi:hypothetical protein
VVRFPRAALAASFSSLRQLFQIQCSWMHCKTDLLSKEPMNFRHDVIGNGHRLGHSRAGMGVQNFIHEAIHTMVKFTVKCKHQKEGSVCSCVV